jgi:heavy metal translocating P-type ATPase
VQRSRFAYGLLAFVSACLLGGIALWVVGLKHAADVVWMCGAVAALIPLAYEVGRSILARQPGVDLIALLAIGGSLALEEYLAGAVIAVMLATGRSLESAAAGRAKRELSSLISRAPREAHRYANGGIATVPVEDVVPGDVVLVKPGEIVPVDGIVATEAAVLDESALTGESRPIERARTEQVRSGAVNAGPAFDLRAIATAERSTYAGVIRLVRQAEQEKAPFVRMADRFALIFVPVTLVVAGIAWALSGDAERALAVVVVATPCPLILAAPVAFVSGISRAARRGLIVKNGAALEASARATILLFDKTGTLTAGAPRVVRVEAFGALPPDEILRLAASLDQVSPHVLASAIVRAAGERGLRLDFPSAVEERAGAGIEGTVSGHVIRLGSSEWVTEGGPIPPGAHEIKRRSSFDGSTTVLIGVDGSVAGAAVLDDPIRPETPRAIRHLRRAGIERVVMLTGDHPDVAETVGAAIGVDHIYAERSPEEKVDAVRSERADGVTIMVGDGINDAPALAAAHVGVAMGARGASASSEAADVVVMVDRVDRLVDLFRIAGRSRHLALQSVLVGMGLSFVAMLVAAAGFLPPIAGALLQEAIDVAVILNALRALAGDRSPAPVPVEDVVTGDRYRAEHVRLAPLLDELRAVADRLDSIDPREARRDLVRVVEFLNDSLLPHERDEETAVYPAISKVLGGEDPMGPMSRAHMEIGHLARLLTQLVAGLPDDGPSAEDLPELRRILYGLHTVLRLHFAQEDEAYQSLFDRVPEPVAVAS